MFSFPLHDSEKLLELHRQTEARLILPALGVLVLLYVPLAYLLQYGLVYQYRYMVLIWIFLVLGWAVWTYFKWLLKLYIFTNQRLILVEYLKPFHRKTAEYPLDRVVGITCRSRGILAGLFGYGNIEVEIAGRAEPIVLVDIRQPAAVKDYLWKIIPHYTNRQ